MSRPQLLGLARHDRTLLERPFGFVHIPVGHEQRTRPDWQQMKALHEQMQQETLQKLSSVLSATQLKKFQVIQQEMHSHMGHHMGHGGPEAATTPPAQN